MSSQVIHRMLGRSAARAAGTQASRAARRERRMRRLRSKPAPSYSLARWVASGLLAPAFEEVMFHAELVADPADDEIDHLADRLGAGVERGRRRQHDRP